MVSWMLENKEHDRVESGGMSLQGGVSERILLVDVLALGEVLLDKLDVVIGYETGYEIEISVSAQIDLGHHFSGGGDEGR